MIALVSGGFHFIPITKNKLNHLISQSIFVWPGNARQSTNIAFLPVPFYAHAMAGIRVIYLFIQSTLKGPLGERIT